MKILSRLGQRNTARKRNSRKPGAILAGTLFVGLTLILRANAGPQNPGAPATGAQSTSSSAQILFEPMPDFDVDQNEDVALDFYVFGYLPDTPRIEGHRTTTSYQLQHGKPMPGALGVCRKFIEKLRQAGGEILYDNDRNIVTGRITQAGLETWAEIACDKDRYRTNIVERQAAGTAPLPPDPANTDAKVREAVKANADKAFDELNAPEGKKNLAASPAGSSSLVHNPDPDPEPFTFAKAAGGKASPPAGSRPPIIDGKTERKTVTIISKAPAGTKFAIVPSGGSVVPCAAMPTLVRRGYTRGCASSTADKGLCDQVANHKLYLVDTSEWSCLGKDGAVVKGALVSDRPLQ